MRRKVTRDNSIEPDLKYSSLLVAKLINQIMYSGKKSVAEKIVYNALDRLEKQMQKPALEMLDLAIDTAGPQLELKSRRIGGANYQVPFEVKGDRKVTLALRWIIGAARSVKGKSMEERLYLEFLNAINNTGIAIKKKLDTHKMAEANRAFAHFAW